MGDHSDFAHANQHRHSHQIRDEVINDPRLSVSDLGILLRIYASSINPFTLDDLKRELDVGRDKASAAVNRLIKMGYVIRRQTRMLGQIKSTKTYLIPEKVGQ